MGPNRCPEWIIAVTPRTFEPGPSTLHPTVI